MSTRYSPAWSSEPARTASATLSGGAPTGIVHEISSGILMIVWRGSSLDTGALLGRRLSGLTI
jgi:hypothetical protein